jgi:hypothetical protein
MPGQRSPNLTQQTHASTWKTSLSCPASTQKEDRAVNSLPLLLQTLQMTGFFLPCWKFSKIYSESPFRKWFQMHINRLPTPKAWTRLSPPFSPSPVHTLDPHPWAESNTLASHLPELPHCRCGVDRWEMHRNWRARISPHGNSKRVGKGWKQMLSDLVGFLTVLTLPLPFFSPSVSPLSPYQGP